MHNVNPPTRACSVLVTFFIYVMSPYILRYTAQDKFRSCYYIFNNGLPKMKTPFYKWHMSIFQSTAFYQLFILEATLLITKCIF